jgi:hypothetical protein
VTEGPEVCVELDRPEMKLKVTLISGFRRDVDEICALWDIMWRVLSVECSILVFSNQAV